MPRVKRSRLASRPPSSAAVAANPTQKRGWLFSRCDPSQYSPADDNGTPLMDEIILFIFATFLEITDLVHGAATCRRWRRLVSIESAFICRELQRPGPSGKFLPPLTVGFFHHNDATAIRFVPMDSASRRFPVLRGESLSLSMLVDNGLFDSSRIVASRNGLLVVELRRGKHSRTLRLCVCNPMTGKVDVLPSLSGKDGVGYYACTVLTADDYQVQNRDTNTPQISSVHYQLLMVYNRRSFTAFRSYSSEHNYWNPQRTVTGAWLGREQMGLTHGGVVACGGRAAYWIARDVVFGLRLDMLEATVARLPRSGGGEAFNMHNTLLGMTPEGRLCAVQCCPLFLQSMEDTTWQYIFRIRVMTYGASGSVDNGILQLDDNLWMRSFEIERSLPRDVRSTKVRLQWFCEKSGLVFFTIGDYSSHRADVYALSLETMMVEKMASNDGGSHLWSNLYGYEMDQMTYLRSLAGLERDDMEDN